MEALRSKANGSTKATENNTTRNSSNQPGKNHLRTRPKKTPILLSVQRSKRAAARECTVAPSGLLALASVEDVIEGGLASAGFERIEAHIASHSQVHAVLPFNRAHKSVTTLCA